MPALTLHTGIASGFTTKGSQLTIAEGDNNLIQLKAEIDAMVVTLSQIATHTRNQDQALDQDGASEVTAGEIRTVIDYSIGPGGGVGGDTLIINAGRTAYEITTNAYGNYYQITNVAVTNIAVMGTYENINCALAAGDGTIKGFSVSGNVITYTGVKDVTVEVNWTCSCLKTGGAAFDEIRIGIELDGVLQKALGVRDANNSELGSLSVSMMIDVSNGNDLALMVTNVDSTSNIVIQDQSIMLHTV